jgi:hypothetical protein
MYSMAQQPLVGQGLFIIEASRSHSVGLLGTNEQPDTYNSQTSMPPGGFEPAIPASEQPQTHALDRAATGIVFVNI